MTLSQLSPALRFDLSGALARFGGSEALLLRLPEDKTFAELSAAVSSNDLPGVERAAHTLKGVAANLGLEALQASSDALVVAVRTGAGDQIPTLFVQLRGDYETACRDIAQL